MKHHLVYIALFFRGRSDKMSRYIHGRNQDCGFPKIECDRTELHPPVLAYMRWSRIKGRSKRTHPGPRENIPICQIYVHFIIERNIQKSSSLSKFYHSKKTSQSIKYDKKNHLHPRFNSTANRLTCRFWTLSLHGR